MKAQFTVRTPQREIVAVHKTDNLRAAHVAKAFLDVTYPEPGHVIETDFVKGA